MKRRQNYQSPATTPAPTQKGSHTTALPSDAFRCHDFSHLCRGDLIEARQNDKVHHRGHIEDAHPEFGVFWIQDTITGTRRLIDFDSFEISYGRQAEAVAAPV